MANQTIEITTENEDGEEMTHELPAKYEVCHRCRGNGQHSNPSIDGNGITSSEWAEWDEEDRETYLSGGYDVTCETCHGLRVVSVVDEAGLTPEQREIFEQHEKNEADRARWDAEDRATRRMEDGGY